MQDKLSTLTNYTLAQNHNTSIYELNYKSNLKITKNIYFNKVCL